MDKLALVLFCHLLKPCRLSLPHSQHWFMADGLTPAGNLQHPSFPLLKHLLRPTAQYSPSAPLPLGTRYFWVGGMPPCKVSAEKSPDIHSHFPLAQIKAICYVYYDYSLNPFHFKHPYSLPSLLGPSAEHPEGRLEHSGVLTGRAEQLLVPLGDQLVSEGRIRGAVWSHSGEGSTNPVCEGNGSRAGPQMTRPSLKYHTGLCFSLYKSNKGYRSGREPLLSGTGNALHHWGENTEGSSGETSASVCPHTPAVDPCAGDIATAKPENKANTVRSRSEPLRRKRRSMAFTPVCRGKRSSPMPTAPRIHLLHPQVSTPRRSFMALPFTPTDYFGLCLNLSLCAFKSHMPLKYLLCKQVSFPGKQGEEQVHPWGHLPVKQASRHLRSVPRESRGC